MASYLFQHTIDEVENLIKKHEAFEKSAAAQEERFAALERLTTVRVYILFCCIGLQDSIRNHISLHFFC